MKGIIFTEFFEMVEQKFDYTMVDKLLTNTQLPSGGVYTAVGTYSHTEMVSLVVSLSQETSIPIPDLLKVFGGYLFKIFSKSYSHFIENAPDAFTFLKSIHNYIHVEVRKLYPDAELPHFEIEHPQPNILVMDYHSIRKMSDLAFGLIEACLEHFEENASISQEVVNHDGSLVKFVIVKQ
ncbi:heme NO-binding domain-containing protein [Emticicia sp. W12TSBA100-4]|uniref:heme NO-binding domain-containing protein n=1 Tax=Emticicia sp. W12TSBA100-4 TaxID=3160965 RepID=UPI0033064DE7